MSKKVNGVPEKKQKTPEIKMRSNIFNLVAQIRFKMKLGECKDIVWFHDIGDWKLGINGFPDHQVVYPRGCAPMKLRPFSVVIWYKGRVVAWCNPKYIIMIENYSVFDGAPKFTIEDIERLLENELARC